MEPIKVGLIGCGGISKAHVAGYLANADQIRLVATSDINLVMAQDRAHTAGADSVYADYRELLEQSDIDAVDVCLPHHLHAEVSIAALNAGKHVLVEKPMATTVEDAEAMVQAAAKAGRTLMAGQNQRFLPENRRIKQLIDDNVIGNVFCARIDVNQYLDEAGHHAPPDTWLHINSLAGGGVVMANTVHELDLLRWLVGEAKRVCSFQGTFLSKMEGEDTSVAIIEFESGAVAEVVSLFAARWSPWGEYRLLYGTEGVIHALRGGPVHVHSTQIPGWNENYTELRIPREDSWVNEIRHFAECIIEDREPLTSGQDNLQTIKLAIAFYESAASGQVVHLN